MKHEEREEEYEDNKKSELDDREEVRERETKMAPSTNDFTEDISRALFPSKLYLMLEDPHLKPSVISWSENGLSWKVHNQEELEKELPRYFKHR